MQDPAEFNDLVCASAHDAVPSCLTKQNDAAAAALAAEREARARAESRERDVQGRLDAESAALIAMESSERDARSLAEQLAEQLVCGAALSSCE